MGHCRAAFPSPRALRRDVSRPLPTLLSIFFSIMLHEANEDLTDGVYIRFRTEGNLFNLRGLPPRKKTIEELITELLFADDCALPAHTEKALQHIVTRISNAAKNFGLTISLKKTEVLYKPLKWKRTVLKSTSMVPTKTQWNTSL